jgi:NAD dependent epimerase/dehydratase
MEQEEAAGMGWKRVKVLVTGADGFIGSHLVERLVGLGADVRAFCLYSSNGSLGWLDGAEPEVRGALDVRLGDIRDARFVEQCCRDVDTVFHLAALVAVPYSYLAPESFVDTNIKGTLNVLEGVRRAGCRRLVQTSTSEVYGTPATLPITENHPLRGQSPYSASKIAADKLCEAYHHTFKLPVVTVRPFNTYGPRQSTRAVIPTIITQALTGDVIRLGDLNTTRDFTFVADTVEGFWRASQMAGIAGQEINVGTDAEISIGDLARLICQLIDKEPVIEVDPLRLRPAASEVRQLWASPARCRELLGWSPSTDLKTGLNLTIDWFRANLGRYHPGEYTV